MPGTLWKCIAGAVLGSLFGSCLVIAEPKDNQKNQTATVPPDGFRFFKKEPSIVTSVIVRVYEHGKFVGFLLVDRGRAPLGIALPGGIVRYHENPVDCVKRTLFDECGISMISNVQQFNVFSDPARDPRMHAVDITYSARIDDQKISGGTDAKHAWVCPIEKIPWDKLVFDHKDMLKMYLEHLITSNDRIEHPEKIQFGSGTKNGVRNKKDFESVAKQAYRPPHLFVAGIVEVYKNDEFKGIAITDFQADPKVKLLPGGGVAYGETIENAFQRHIKNKYRAAVAKILCQFKAYSFFNNDGKKHDVTTVLLAKMDEKDIGTLKVYPLKEVPLKEAGFHHKNILEDYLKYKNGEAVHTCSSCMTSAPTVVSNQQSTKESSPKAPDNLPSKASNDEPSAVTNDTKPAEVDKSS